MCKDLFTFILKTKILYVKRVLEVGLGIVLLGLVLQLFNYVYVEKYDWSRILWHNYYETKNIDNIFVGSSHVYCDVDPFLMDEINGMDNFNISVPVMRLNGAYYAIKEAAGDHELKNVYLELYHGVICGDFGDVESEVSIRDNWYLSDYLKPSWNRFQYRFSMSNPNTYLETIIPFVRYRANIFDTDYVRMLIEKKASDEYQNFSFCQINEGERTEYHDKGYLYTTRQLSNHLSIYNQSGRNLQTEGYLSTGTENYLRKIIEYCQDKDINIELFVAPMYGTQVLSTIEYDQYNQRMVAMAKEYGVNYYDFNLCRTEYLDIMHREYFMDEGHLNSIGADVFTPFLWEVLSGDPETNQKYFCQSYKEKISLDEPEIYGVYFYLDEEQHKIATIACNRDWEMEYRISIIPDGKEKQVIQAFSENKDFILSADESGEVIIDSRLKSNPEQMMTLRLKY